ncbi:O-antigen ligase family protein [Cellvibrio sp. OA-2007]|uniref:O-antigen ligase family protein n=1 Tax=Cellvibrio sp. OA-2007 TaxID=529823 RepID=UPI0007840220|nr:O-antigen ligase family protein [Cellvibrio sp. OA-2007]
MSNETVENFYAFKVGAMWRYFKKQHFSFWMICGYLFFEFVKPQALFPQIDFLPWAQLLLMGAMVGAFIDPTVKWVSSASNVLIVLFFITILISILCAIYTDVAQQHFTLFFSWFVIYFLIINIVNTPQRLYLFLLIYLLAAGKIALGTSKSWAFRGFSFTSWGLMGPKGYFQNSGELAILMLMLFPLAFYMYQYLKDKVLWWEKALLIAFWVCPILTILGASSRGAQVALVVQLAVMFRKSLFRIKPLIGIMVLCTSLYYLLPQEQKDRFSSAGDDKTSEQRLLYWKHGWEMMKDYPITGVGYFNFIPYYEAHFSYDMLYPRAQLPHNIFIQVGTDAGFIALIFFIMIIGYCFTAIWRFLALKTESLFNNIAVGLAIGVLGFLVAGQFVTVSYYPFLWVHLAFIVCLTKINKPVSRSKYSLNAAKK